MRATRATRLLKGGSAALALAFALVGIGRAAGIRTVLMKDQCDPASFNAAIGPGTCVGHNGGVSFDTFVQQLQHAQKAGAWHFAPANVELRDGEAVQAENTGGEVHTFTEVDEFGGGIVPFLNQLTDNPVTAPECLALSGGDFIAPGGTSTPEVEEPGIHHYQCCIHPWMRTDVVVR